MKNPFLPMSILCSLLCSCCGAEEVVAIDLCRYPTVYRQIKDLRHPTHADYQLVQDYLRHGERDLRHQGDTTSIVKNITIIDVTTGQLPQKGASYVHCSSEEKENCIILYSTYNRNYPNALTRLVRTIEQSDFRGHVLYRTGGWPNEEAGDIVLSHVPYAFKACFFQEAQRLGYKRCLWLDTSILPVVSLNDIFAMIEEKGYFFVDCGGTTIGPYMNEQAAAAFGLSLEESKTIESIAAFIIGIDFTNPKAKAVIDTWYQAAHHKDAFFSARCDQNALSIILHQQKIHDFVSIHRLPHVEVGEKVQPDSLFIVDRLFAHHGHS